MSSVVNSERMPNVTTVQVGTQAATITLPSMNFRKKSRIKEVRYTDQAGLAADNTNFLQLSLQQGDGTVIAALDTRAANNGALTANTSKALTLTNNAGSTSQPENEVAAGTDTKLVVTKNGTGVPTLGQLYIEWYPL
jgi:hypothetical protein